MGLMGIKTRVNGANGLTHGKCTGGGNGFPDIQRIGALVKPLPQVGGAFEGRGIPTEIGDEEERVGSSNTSGSNLLGAADTGAISGHQL